MNLLAKVHRQVFETIWTLMGLATSLSARSPTAIFFQHDILPSSYHQGIKPGSLSSQTLLLRFRLEPGDQDLAQHCFSGCPDTEYISGPVYVTWKWENWFGEIVCFPLIPSKNNEETKECE